MDTYQIRIVGRLDQHWSAWFDGFQITYDADGNTSLTGVVVDQAGLMGLINKVRDLGLSLIALGPCNAAITPSSTVRSPHEED